VGRLGIGELKWL